MNEFALMSNALSFTYKSLLEAKNMNEWQCLLCSATFDGVLHTKPDRCPECNAPDGYITSAFEQAEIEDENRRINKQEEMKDE